MVFGFLSKKEIPIFDQKLSGLDQKLQSSFSKVKDDVTKVTADVNELKKWISYLNYQNQQKDELLRQVHSSFEYVPKLVRDTVREEVDKIFKMDEITHKLDALSQKVSLLEGNLGNNLHLQPYFEGKID